MGGTQKSSPGIWDVRQAVPARESGAVDLSLSNTLSPRLQSSSTRGTVHPRGSRTLRKCMAGSRTLPRPPAATDSLGDSRLLQSELL